MQSMFWALLPRNGGTRKTAKYCGRASSINRVFTTWTTTSLILWPSQGFRDLQTVRDWVQRFATWYNNEHCHSRISFVTPSQRHRGDDKALLVQRKTVYEKARQRNPLRWSGKVRNWQHIKTVSLNPGKPESAEAKAA